MENWRYEWGIGVLNEDWIISAEEYRDKMPSKEIYVENERENVEKLCNLVV